MDLQSLLTSIGNTRSNPPDSATYTWYPTAAESDRSQPHYVNKDVKLGIDFQVSKLPFEALQVMDARLVTIAPGSCNEKHRHSHEAIFVLLSGQGEIIIDHQAMPLELGCVASVPRWVVHQCRNTSSEAPLMLLAITDFGLTSAVLGKLRRQDKAQSRRRRRLRRRGSRLSPSLRASNTPNQSAPILKFNSHLHIILPN